MSLETRLIGTIMDHMTNAANVVQNIADLVDPDDSQGRTYRQINNAIPNNIPVGTLVEVKYEEWHGDGACEIVHARLWVVVAGRDCDGTPLYWLSPSPRHKWDDISITFSDKEGISFRTKLDISQNMFYKVKGGFREEDLKVIEVTPELKAGVGALKLPKVK